MPSEKEKKALFRQKSLDRLSSPDRLDELMVVLKPKSWIPLSTLGTLVVIAIVWSVFGRIPENVTGAGILIFPGRIVSVQTEFAGQQIDELYVKPGQIVKGGDLIAIVDQTQLQQKLRHAQEALASQEAEASKGQSFRAERMELERNSIASRRAGLEVQIAANEALAEEIKSVQLATLREDRPAQEKQLAFQRERIEKLAERVESAKRLETRGLISESQVLQVTGNWTQALTQLFQLEKEMRNARTQELQLNVDYQRRQEQIQDLQQRLEQLLTEEKGIEERELEKVTGQTFEMDRTRHEIAQLELQLAMQGRITSPFSGRLVELTAFKGQVIPHGGRIAAIEVNEGAEPLRAVTYFQIKDGKRVQPGMDMLITPDTVKRERFGSLRGKVVSVTELPVSQEEVAAAIGLPEVVKEMTKQGPVLQIVGALNVDRATFSGYEWSSSSGPKLKMTAGVTTLSQVTVEQRAPITFLLPLLREWTGL